MPYWIKNYQDNALVENYLNSYEEETSNAVTSMEVDFIEQQIPLNKNSKIVDVCCADGRHLLEFAKRGYKDLTGVDLSPLMLSILADKSNNKIKLLNKDMRYLGDLQADLILNLFSSCGFFDTDTDNYAFFESVNKALKVGGMFCLDITHRESYIKTLQPQEWKESKNYIVLKEQKIDLDTSRYIRKTIYINKTNNQRTERFSSARIFSIYEINEWLKKAGFYIMKRFGDMELNANPFIPDISDRLCIIAVKEREI